MLAAKLVVEKWDNRQGDEASEVIRRVEYTEKSATRGIEV
jgi:hypothetical protein